MNYQSLSTEFISFGGLFSNGRRYIVPPFQRDYSWEQENWQDLWNDLESVAHQDTHFMGYLVLQVDASTRETYKVIDGQQRITSLRLIVLACLQCLKELVESGIAPAENQSRMQLFTQQFISFEDQVKLTPLYRLRLNRNNETFNYNRLQNLEVVKRDRVAKADQLLKNGFFFFFEKIKEKFPNPKGEEIADFLIQKITDTPIFSVIRVPDEVKAYTIFETLNARGVQLSSTDLLKNLLFEHLSEDDETLANAEQLWKEISEGVDAKKLPVYLRHFWNAFNPLTTNTELFRAIKKHLVSHENVTKQALALLQRLNRQAKLYASFKEPQSSFWSEAGKETQHYLQCLEMIKVTQCYPLMLAAYEKMDASDFGSLLRYIFVISFRYITIGKLGAYDMESFYNKAALAVHQSDNPKRLLSEVKQILRPLYIDDEQFRHTFSGAELKYPSQKKVIQYVLIEMEQSYTGKQEAENNQRLTIEHVLPQKPKNGWEDFFPTKQQEDYEERIANYSLLEDPLQKKTANELFEVKKPFLAKSAYQITKSLDDLKEWTPDNLEKRQKEWAKKAVQIWRLDF